MILRYISKILPEEIAYAHCDIPCGIYDPTPLQIAAHTVLRMTQLLGEKKSEHDIARIVHVKEDHGETVEREIGTLENDYFKAEHYEKFTELKNLLSDAVKLSVTCRQSIDVDSAEKLLEIALKVSEVFYKTKGFEPVRISSGYPTGGEIVSHK